MMEQPVAWLVEEGGKRVPLCRCQQGIDPNKAEMLMLLNEMDRESKVDLAGGGRTMAFVEALRQLRAILSVDPRDAEIERLRAELERVTAEAKQHFDQAMANGASAASERARADAAESALAALRKRVEEADVVFIPAQDAGRTMFTTHTFHASFAGKRVALVVLD